MSFGVEIDEYGGRLTAETCHIACQAKVVRLFEFANCGEGRCKLWDAWDAEEAIEKAREAAVRDRVEKERARRLEEIAEG